MIHYGVVKDDFDFGNFLITRSTTVGMHTDPCFYRVTQNCLKQFLDGDGKFVSGTFYTDKVEEMIASFNNYMTNIKVQILHKGGPVDYNWWQFGVGAQKVQTFTYFLHVILSDEYTKELQWAMIVPITQMFRNFSPSYGWFKLDNETDFKKAIRYAHRVAARSYGSWSREYITYKGLATLDRPKVMNNLFASNLKIREDTTNSGTFPKGTALCKIVLDHLKPKPVEVERSDTNT